MTDQNSVFNENHSGVVEDLATHNFLLRKSLAVEKTNSDKLGENIKALEMQIEKMNKTMIPCETIATYVREKFENGLIPIPHDAAKHKLPVKINVYPERVTIAHGDIYVYVEFVVQSSRYEVQFKLEPGLSKSSATDYYPNYLLQYQKPLVKKRKAASAKP